MAVYNMGRNYNYVLRMKQAG